MTGIASSDIVDPSALTPVERERLIDALYAIHLQVFAGGDRAGFAKYVVDSPADETLILCHHNAAGETVGFVGFHVFERRLDSRETIVLRSEAGTLRDYRGGNANVKFALRCALRHLLRHPGRPVYHLGLIIHPSSYMQLARYSPELWPRAGAEVPGDVLDFMDELASSFGLERVDPANPLVRHSVAHTVETDFERAYWAQCDKPAARFFLEANPGYGEGHGLVTLAPLSVRAVYRLLAGIARKRARAPLARAWALAEATPPGARAVRRRTLQQLQASEVFAGAREATLQRLADRAEVLTVSGGRPVFERGDLSDELYLLASGAAVYVTVGEEVVDELTEGAVFGELAMLAGERRSATVRTATTSVIVRIPRSLLLPLMDDDPALSAGVWRTFGERRFDSLVRGDERLAHLGRRARLEWYESGDQETLAAGETAVLAAGAPAFVISGVLELQHDGLALVGRGSLLLEPEQPLSVRAREPVRLVRLPRAPNGGAA